MKYICFGGSFNPIHHGHLICARAVAEAAGFDRVILIPSGNPPHKEGQDGMAAGEDRAAMCRAAVEGDKLFEVNDLEIKKEGPSYTIETVRELKRRGWDQVAWLVGADMLLNLPTWYQFEALLEEADFYVMARPGWRMDWDNLPKAIQKLHKNLIIAPQIDISATDIRARVKAGLGIDYLMPPSVVRYIRERGLYR